LHGLIKVQIFSNFSVLLKDTTHIIIQRARSTVYCTEKM